MARNCFGEGSPDCNVPFPCGNITAAEILTFLPHWLKSIDVIDRFVTNGATTRIIAEMVKEFRSLPKEATFAGGNIGVMMQQQMRRAGYHGWIPSQHGEFARTTDWDESNLSVKEFRNPRVTHPPKSKASRPDETTPIPFTDLLLFVKKLPTGDDALDLTRCVQHAAEHPDETWMFPTDYRKLVELLGGGKIIKCAHWDTQAFGRRGGKGVIKLDGTNKTEHCMPRYPSGTTSVKTVMTDDTKRARRSTRLEAKSKLNFTGLGEDVDSTTETVEGTNTKKRRRDVDIDSDYEDKDESDGDDDEESGDITEEELTDPHGDTSKLSRALDAKAKLRSHPRVSTTGPPATKRLKTAEGPKPIQRPRRTESSRRLDKAICKAARFYDYRPPDYLKPPDLSRDRQVITPRNVLFYAEDNAKDPWASALSSVRFNGPRRNPPWRELHRLTDPPKDDVGDWAENIRWAKQQYKLYGSVWTEYKYHLDLIKEHRRKSLWASEELIGNEIYWKFLDKMGITHGCLPKLGEK